MSMPTLRQAAGGSVAFSWELWGLQVAGCVRMTLGFAA